MVGLKWWLRPGNAQHVASEHMTAKNILLSRALGRGAEIGN